MARSRPDLFGTIRTEGALLPPELLARVAAGDPELRGLDPASYHLGKGERFGEAISRSWNRLIGVWTTFSEARAKLPESDPATGLTREKWLLILFQELGFGRLQPTRSVEINGKSYPVSHEWLNSPIHLVGTGVPLDRRTERVAGAARYSPHGMVQELLNVSDGRLWGIVSNGHLLRVLRDNSSLTRQAYVEFDLKSMMDGEVYSDFAVLWLVAHQSRFEGDRPEDCWLEKWSAEAQAQGTRALDDLRNGVETALNSLGRGFLSHPANGALRYALRGGQLTDADYYRRLLRLAYRLIFLMVAEDRDALHPPDAPAVARARYRDHYSLARLRRMADRRRGSRHPDLWQALRVVMEALGTPSGCPSLGLPALGGLLWAPEAATAFVGCAELSNRDLLEAVRALAFTTDSNVRRPVDYRNMGPEEFGSIYESLLELHPELNVDAGTFALSTAAGSERKTTGSYYTPTSLIAALLDSALDPVLDQTVEKPDPEGALLALKIVDPACGSGHFLIAAAHRLSKRLAALRTGDDEPAPEAIQTALRDVIGRCIYGVDLNPMAVELCKINLWMEALVPGRPLSFLDHHIRCGNSLIGTTPALMAGGIPEDAFSPIEGDDKAVVSALKKQNKQERPEGRRAGQTAFILETAEPRPSYGQLAPSFEALIAMPDADIGAVQEKQKRYESLVSSREYRNAHQQADAWCAAFMWRKVPEWREGAVTHNVLMQLLTGPDSVPEKTRDEIAHLADQYQFFHWHLAFPEAFTVPEGRTPESRLAGWSGGFNVVLGNPPWERIKIQEKEWFAQKRPDIANAPNAAARRKLIDKLEADDPGLHAAFLDDRRRAEGESHFVRNSARYPLCGRGDVNTYTIFAETNRLLVSAWGRVGVIVPSGIATDDTTKFFFQDLMDSRSLVSLFDFENREGIFPAVDSRIKFCLLTLTGVAAPAVSGAEFVFFAHRTEDLNDTERRFVLSAEDIALLNPNTRTCPVFRSRRDAEITKAVYRRVPVLIREGPPEENPWGVSFMAMFHMSNDSHLFRTREQLEGEGWALEGNVFCRDAERYLPLYEAKMVGIYDHRVADVVISATAMIRQGQPDALSDEDHADPCRLAIPRYWVSEKSVDERLMGKWNKGWLLGWRDVTSVTNERTVIAGVVPRVGVGNNLPISLLSRNGRAACLLASISSFALDYAARFKVGGTHLNFFITNQLPVLPPPTYDAPAPWGPSARLTDWITTRVIELTYTAIDMKPFAEDFGYKGPPFRWDPDRRFQIRCELDAAFLHLYGISRDDVDYIMGTFPIVRRKDEAEYGSYRTRTRILEVYDAMAEAAATGRAFVSTLIPPPGQRRSCST